MQDVKHRDELMNFLVIIKPDIPDLRDFPRHKLTSVLEGSALLLKQPTVPHFLLNSAEVLFERDTNRSECVEDEFTAQANKILDTSARQSWTTLLKLPEGMKVSTDLRSNCATILDTLIKAQIRFIEDASVLFGSMGKKINHTWKAIHWVVCVID